MMTNSTWPAPSLSVVSAQATRRRLPSRSSQGSSWRPGTSPLTSRSSRSRVVCRASSATSASANDRPRRSNAAHPVSRSQAPLMRTMPPLRSRTTMSASAVSRMASVSSRCVWAARLCRRSSPSMSATVSARPRPRPRAASVWAARHATERPAIQSAALRTPWTDEPPATSAVSSAPSPIAEVAAGRRRRPAGGASQAGIAEATWRMRPRLESGRLLNTAALSAPRRRS